MPTLPHVARGVTLAALTFTGSQLRLDDLPADAPNVIEIRGDDVVPTDVEPAGRPRVDVPLLLMPGVEDPVVVNVLGASRSIVVADAPVPRIAIDARRYDAPTAWRPQAATPERRRTVMLLAVALAATLLLARLAPRRAWIAVAAVGVAWSIALAIALGRRQTLFVQDNGDGTRWVATLVPHALQVPIRAGEPWVPVVESVGQLRSLDPRIVVGRDRATLTLTLPANGKIVLALP